MNDIVKRIQKLLNLANSSNEHEAKAAAEKAQELLLKHNLDMQSVSGMVFDYSESQVGSNKRMDKRTTYILNVLEKCFFVTYYWKRGYEEREKSIWIGNKIFLYGTPSNVQVASFVFNFLSLAYTSSWLIYKNKSKAQSWSRDAYFLGLTKGLITQLKRNQKKIEDERGLVLIEDPELTKKAGTCKGTSFKPVTKDEDAILDGYREGLEMRISKALENNTESRGLLIGAQ